MDFIKKGLYKNQTEVKNFNNKGLPPIQGQQPNSNLE